MKNHDFKRTSAILVLLLVFILGLAGCGQSGGTDTLNSITPPSSVASSESTPETSFTLPTPNSELPSSPSDSSEESSGDAATQSALTVRFGDDGAPFTMHLYDNDTAAAIAKHVGTAAWRLPIYNFDNFDNWEVMQYYDIPGRYEIPEASEAVTEEKAGEVYYSAPNRIVLFYNDAQVSGSYTKIGYFEYTDEFLTAVEENPVLEGWENKIIHISPAE